MRGGGGVCVSSPPSIFYVGFVRPRVLFVVCCSENVALSRRCTFNTIGSDSSAEGERAEWRGGGKGMGGRRVDGNCVADLSASTSTALRSVAHNGKNYLDSIRQLAAEWWG